MLEWDPKKPAYVVYDHEVKSAHSVKPQLLQPIVCAPTEMAPDLVAGQLDFDQIQAHMLSSSMLLWAALNLEASKLMFTEVCDVCS